jgi:Flp pilus assembly protein TadG
MAALTTARRSTERGQAVIELALTLPLLLVVVFGIIDFGFMFQRYEAVTNAAREGARIGVLADYTATEAQNRALDYLVASGLNGPVKTVDQVTMIVEYDHQYQFVGPIMGLFGSNLASIRLRSASSMRRE